MSHSRITGRVPVFWPVVAVLVAAAVATTALVAGRHHAGAVRAGVTTAQRPPASVTFAPPSTGSAGTSRQPTRSTHRAGQVALIGSSGSSLEIPALGVDAPLVATGAVGAPGAAALTIPADIGEVGWWDGVVRDGATTTTEPAPRPGAPGVAVLAGHVDSAQAGPGALFHLADLRVGDTITIVDTTGARQVWVVTRPPVTALKTELPSSLWVTTGAPRLAVVTCGGPFDAAIGHYLDNVIVWARPAT